MASRFRVGTSVGSLSINLLTLVLARKKREIGSDSSTFAREQEGVRRPRVRVYLMCAMQMQPSIELTADDDDFEDVDVPAPAEPLRQHTKKRQANSRAKPRNQAYHSQCL